MRQADQAIGARLNCVRGCRVAETAGQRWKANATACVIQQEDVKGREKGHSEGVDKNPHGDGVVQQ